MVSKQGNTWFSSPSWFPITTAMRRRSGTRAEAGDGEMRLRGVNRG